MRVALLTREFPPEVYGGAGVHVEYLAARLAELIEVEVHCFGAPRASPLVAASYEPFDAIVSHAPWAAALRTLSVDLAMAAALENVEVVHSHTWYANMAGYLAKLVHGVPHVMTAHSLEPLRPWKAEQLQGGYAVSLWSERTAIESADAVVAVSAGMRADILAAYPVVDPERVVVIHNGVDPDEYRPTPGSGTGVAERVGVDPLRPSVLFVGRITRQKGIEHLLRAGVDIDPNAQLVLCAGSPDTPAIGDEMREKAAELSRRRDVVWIDEMLPRRDVIELMSLATVFVCPSVYEPFGLINLEAMACGTAVVASAVGGIPEIVVEGETGRLVALEAGSDPYGSPADEAAFAHDLARAVNDLVAHPDLASRYGRAGRERVTTHFSWSAIAAETVELYERVISGRAPSPG